jgi:alkylation response protein AidB-like acyl-CoA dehydrogenase
MDFRTEDMSSEDLDTEEGKKFRQKVRDFLKENLTTEVVEERGHYYETGPHTQEFNQKLASTGWTRPSAPEWPQEYGGVVRTEEERRILAEELGILGGGTSVGRGIVGPIVMLYGTEEQKRGFLPKIAREELTLALGYSEPNAGTDLAALEMCAVRDGDEYIINGQKVYSTGAHYATHHWLAARTNPSTDKHEGISLFIVDLKSPGITIIHMVTIAGEKTHQVFYDDVRVPVFNRIGEEDRGWPMLRQALGFERTVVVHIVSGQSVLDELVQYAKETKRDGRPLSRDPLVRQSLAQLAIETSIRRLFAYRTAWMIKKGMVPEVEAAMQKVWGHELDPRMANEGLKIMGLYAQLEPESKWAPIRGSIEHLYRFAVHLTYGGGSHELMRNLMATRGMGLPREPRLQAKKD